MSGIALALVFVFGGCEAFRGIEGDWGGYWWYAGTRGNVYITWSFGDGQFRGAIPSAPAKFSGTYTVGEGDDAGTIDLKVAASDTTAWVIGETYRGYYRIDGGVMYRSQLLPKRPAWSASLLDPQVSTVFVAERAD
ncbi:MAG: hypothetical protein FJ225_07135 [Lentisphaerae bacterium]|nr:hypothetical protein [Lentisphaerota bacterium]